MEAKVLPRCRDYLGNNRPLPPMNGDSARQQRRITIRITITQTIFNNIDGIGMFILPNTQMPRYTSPTSKTMYISRKMTFSTMAASRCFQSGRELIRLACAAASMSCKLTTTPPTETSLHSMDCATPINACQVRHVRNARALPVDCPLSSQGHAVRLEHADRTNRSRTRSCVHS
jgi:hypothetical protein